MNLPACKTCGKTKDKHLSPGGMTTGFDHSTYCYPPGTESRAAGFPQYEPRRVVVLASAVKSRFFPNDIKVGFRTFVQTGDPYDFFWGSTLPANLDAVLARIRQEKGEFDLLDLRGTPEAVRDRAYWETQTA